MGLTVVDPMQALREAEAEGRQMYGRIDAHFTQAGHEVVYGLIAPEGESSHMGTRNRPAAMGRGR